MNKRKYLLATALLLTAGASAMLQKSSAPVQISKPSNINTSTDGAYRDGVFMGEHAAKAGQVKHAAIARWSTAEDRISFLAGYAQGYAESR